MIESIPRWPSTSSDEASDHLPVVADFGESVEKEAVYEGKDRLDVGFLYTFADFGTV